MSQSGEIVEPKFENSKSKFLLFGKDFREIKCFRSSFLYGISGGLIAALVSFMATSKALFSTHVGFGSTWIIVFGYWIPCRYQYETSISILESLKKELAQQSKKPENKDREKDS